MNFKSLILGSAFVLSLFGLTACGDDSSANSENEENQPEEYKPPVASDVSPIMFNGLAGNLIGSADGEGQSLSFSGMIQIDPDFNDPDANFTANVDVVIDSIQFQVVYEKDGKTYKDSVPVNLDANFPTYKVLLTKKGFDLSKLSTCGDFNFNVYIVVYSHAEEEGFDAVYYTSVNHDIIFENKCKVEVSSSSVAEVCTSVASTEVTLSNIINGSMYELNFATGTKDNPHIKLVVDENVTYLEAVGAGVQIFEEYDEKHAGGIPPDASECLETFKKIGAGKTKVEVAMMGWYIVETAEGSFPLYAGSTVYSDDGNRGSFELTYLKKP